MLKEFHTMWDHHLGRLNQFQHLIKKLIDLQVRPVHSPQNWSVPKPRCFEKKEIEKMLRMGFIEPGNTQRAQSSSSLIITGRIVSASTTGSLIKLP